MSRPLAHPNMEDVTVAGILHALADPVRLAIIGELIKGDACTSCTQINDKLDMAMPKSTCSQHYRILREAGLIVSERIGVELRSHVRMRELDARFPGLLQAILKSYEREVAKSRRRGRASRTVAASVA